MKKLGLILMFCARLAQAQLNTVPNSDFPTFRTNMNNSLVTGVNRNIVYPNPNFVGTISWTKLINIPGVPAFTDVDATITGGRIYTGVFNASGASRTAPAKTGTTLPGSCFTGDQFFKTDAALGSQLYFCNLGAWTQMAGAGSGSGTVQSGTNNNFSKYIGSSTVVGDSGVSFNAIPAANTTFTQTGTGAAARTQDSKNNDYVSVKDFGVAANGSTNDAANFQQAITTAAGGTLHIPAATYSLGSTLFIPGNTSVMCEKGANLLFTGATDGLTMGTTNPLTAFGQNILIDGCTITTSNASAGKAIVSNVGVGAFDTNNSKITNVTIAVTGSGKWNFGMWFNGLETSRIEHILSYQTSNVYIHLEHAANALSFQDISLYGTTGAGITHRCIELANVTFVTDDPWLNNVTCQGFFTQSILFDVASGFKLTNSHFENTNLTPSDGKDIEIQGSLTVYPISISGSETGSINIGNDGCNGISGVSIHGSSMGVVVIGGCTFGTVIQGGHATSITEATANNIKTSIIGVTDYSSSILPGKVAGNIITTPWVSGGGTANAQTVTPDNPVTALFDGLTVCWKPAAANTTTTPTLAYNGLTAHTIVKAGGVLAASDIITTAQACAIYNTTGAHWELQNPQTVPSGGGGGSGVTYCAPASASGTTYTCTPSPALSSYAAGNTLAFVPDVASTGGATTINVSGLGAKSIKIAAGSTDPISSTFVASHPYFLVYNGTNFIYTPDNYDPSKSGSELFSGLTSGGVALAAADVAGTAITYVLPSTNGAANQVLVDTGTTTCPTLSTGIPTTCHLLAWSNIVNANITNSTIDLTAKVTGVLPLANGGTNCAAPFPVLPKTSTYTVLKADFTCFTSITVASGTFTLTLPASGGTIPTAGTWVKVLNYGSGVVTVAIGSGTTINGGSGSLTLAAASATAPTGIWCNSDGTNYFCQTLGASSGGGAGPGVSAYQNATQSIASGARRVLTFNTNLWDTSSGAIHSTSTNPTRFTAPTTGIYLVSCGADWGDSNPASPYLYIRLNGTTDVASNGVSTGTTATFPTISVSAMVSLAATEYAECTILVQNTTNVSAGPSPTFGQMAKLF